MGEEKKIDLTEVSETLKALNRDDLMKTWGFALGLHIKSESAAERNKASA